jgi:formate dehydrogenase major subunit
MIQGSNMAECHPVGFRFVMEARERGATIIHVDPRFTRTSANADLYAPLRPGTDITFLGGLINYVLGEEKFFREYVVAYTNAATIIGEDFRDTEELDGVFSGYQPESGTYDAASWRYEIGEGGVPLRDETLQHPRSVFQILKRHFARYTPEMVEQVCGTPRDVFVKIAETHDRVLLRPRLDPAHHWRPEHPRRRDAATAARQHRTARRRHPGAAWARRHPGFDRYPNPL